MWTEKNNKYAMTFTYLWIIDANLDLAANKVHSLGPIQMPGSHIWCEMLIIFAMSRICWYKY